MLRAAALVRGADSIRGAGRNPISIANSMAVVTMAEAAPAAIPAFSWNEMERILCACYLMLNSDPICGQ